MSNFFSLRADFFFKKTKVGFKDFSKELFSG